MYTVLEDSEQEHQGIEIIECTCTGKLGNKRAYKKGMTERLMKRDENNSKKEGEIILIQKT